MKPATIDWIELAKRDFSAAKKLAEDEYLSNVCLFHCQQTIEKMFKAILEEQGTRIPKIHSVITLHAMLPTEFRNTFIIDQDELGLLDDIYIDSRYPGEIGLLPNGYPTKSDAQNVLDITEKIYRLVIKYFEFED